MLIKYTLIDKELDLYRSAENDFERAQERVEALGN
jgi:hypothetical protein